MKGFWWRTFLIYALAIVVAFTLNKCAVAGGRENHNMVVIEKGYTYEKTTGLIHSEYIGYGGAVSYSTYVNSEGKFCKYNKETGEWMPINN